MPIQRIRVLRARRNVDASAILTVLNPPNYLERGEKPEYSFETQPWGLQRRQLAILDKITATIRYIVFK